MNLKNAVEMNTGVMPPPTVTLETELNQLGESLCNLENHAAELVARLKPVSHQRHEKEPTPGLARPLMPDALTQVRIARERVDGLISELADARVALAL